MNISPKTSLLKSIRAERADLRRLCGEAVDNSLDANATSVNIQVSPAEISFEDNGIGITPDRLHALFTLGEHAGMSSTRLGRFGVGIKMQAVSVADVIEVKTTSAAGRYRARVNWREVLKAGDWEIDDPLRLPELVGAPTGTAITLSVLRPLPRTSHEKIRDWLAETFYPAVVEGRGITLNGVAVPVLPEPEMTDVIDRTLELSGGRGVHVRAGILVQPSRLNMVHVGYGHRVIKAGSSIGCGLHTGLSNMFARVQLVGPWRLGRFKDELTDERERDELEDALAAVLEPILVKCGSASMSARLASLCDLVNDMLPEDLAARPRKLKTEPSRTGDKKRTRKTGDVDSEKSDPSAGGPATTRRSKGDKLLITFDGRAEEHGVGYCDGTSRIKRVHLSRDEPSIAVLFRLRDDHAIANALLVIAMQKYENYRENVLRGQQPEFDFKGFGLRVAEHLRASRVGAAEARA